MSHYREYTLILPPSCPANQDHLSQNQKGPSSRRKLTCFSSIQVLGLQLLIASPAQ